MNISASLIEGIKSCSGEKDKDNTEDEGLDNPIFWPGDVGFVSSHLGGDVLLFSRNGSSFTVYKPKSRTGGRAYNLKMMFVSAVALYCHYKTTGELPVETKVHMGGGFFEYMNEEFKIPNVRGAAWVGVFRDASLLGLLCASCMSNISTNGHSLAHMKEACGYLKAILDCPGETGVSASEARDLGIVTMYETLNDAKYIIIDKQRREDGSPSLPNWSPALDFMDKDADKVKKSILSLGEEDDVETCNCPVCRIDRMIGKISDLENKLVVLTEERIGG